MMSLWDALRMNMMISYQELVRTFPRGSHSSGCPLNKEPRFPPKCRLIKKPVHPRSEYRGSSYPQKRRLGRHTRALSSSTC
ncbi:hypothetical protein EHZ61_13140 [Aeromonas caviae]|nr:hypothetical protein EHZ61_13140 [Aeromonas caviae]